MKFKYIAAAIIVIALIAGCAGAQIKKGELEVKIDPEKGIAPGTIVSVEVKAPDDAVKVYGYLDIWQDFRIFLKYDPNKKIWFRRQMIPVDLVFPKRGEFLIKIEALNKEGEKYQAEKKISTF